MKECEINGISKTHGEMKNEYELLKMATIWVVVLCSLVGVYQRFRGEISVNFYLNTKHNNSQDNHLHTGRRKNLKPHSYEVLV
jgi:hypothetical protein